MQAEHAERKGRAGNKTTMMSPSNGKFPCIPLTNSKDELAQPDAEAGWDPQIPDEPPKDVGRTMKRNDKELPPSASWWCPLPEQVGCLFTLLC